jgi:hypothetical protein
MTPQPPAAAPQQSWFSRNWKLLAGVGCLGSLLCCGGFSVVAALLGQAQPAARVDCGTPGPGGVDCDIKRTEGLSAFKACWELEITCTNQAKMVGKACGSVALGTDAATVNMPVSAFSNQDRCDAPASGVVQQLVITAE